jgi:hypothetical protein
MRTVIMAGRNRTIDIFWHPRRAAMASDVLAPIDKEAQPASALPHMQDGQAVSRSSKKLRRRARNIVSRRRLLLGP